MVAPLIYESSFPEAKKKLLKVIESMPRAEIATDKKNFLHVEFTSKIFRFVDDVEFYFNEPGSSTFDPLLGSDTLIWE